MSGQKPFTNGLPFENSEVELEPAKPTPLLLWEQVEYPEVIFQIKFVEFTHKFLIAYERAGLGSPLDVYYQNVRDFPLLAKFLKKPSSRVQNRILRKRARADLQLQELLLQFNTEFRTRLEEFVELSSDELDLQFELTQLTLETFLTLPPSSVVQTLKKQERFEPILKRYIQGPLKCCCRYRCSLYQARGVQTYAPPAWLLQRTRSTNTLPLSPQDTSIRTGSSIKSDVSVQTERTSNYVRTIYHPAGIDRYRDSCTMTD
ncbi:MAG TPA: hypothetical protein VK145_02065 [Candidatus Nanoarchaeia archaeon]|nr:hypothetical protein [Candidatus Nanoarchaeia archaeon]